MSYACSSVVANRFLMITCGCLASLAVCGCGDRSAVQLVPVAGKVTVGGAALAAGTLSFRPDASKGNTGTLEPAGRIDAQGNYQLFTAGNPGAPVGWYKVMIVALAPADPNNKDPYAPRKSLINTKYGVLAETDAAIEVTENPQAGAYDLNLEN